MAPCEAALSPLRAVMPAAERVARATEAALKRARAGYEGHRSFPPVQAFERTEGSLAGRGAPGRMLDALMSPEVAREEWMASRERRVQRAEYWKAYDRLLHEGVPLLFSEDDVGTEVALESASDGGLAVRGRAVHVLSRGSVPESAVVVASVVPEVGGPVALSDGTVVENGLAEHRKTPYFKYVDMQTLDRPEWGDRDAERFKEVKSGKRGYQPFKTDAAAKKRRKGSRYTQRLKEWLPDMESYDLPALSERTGVPEWVLQKVFDKGMAAWRTGHRPGASQHAWAHARVHSFLVLGCTVFANDDQLAAEAAEEMTDEQLRAWTGQELSCPSYKLKKKYFQRAVKRLQGSRFLEALCRTDRDHVCGKRAV